MMDESRESTGAAGEGDAQRPVVFIHVPKTGGLTMERIIRRQYPDDRSLWISFQRPEMVSSFMALSDEARGRLRCLMGHIPYGFHRNLPESPLHITLLREPVSRFISEYHYLVRHVREGAWRPPDEAMASLDAYLDYRIATHATNVQTAIISGHFPDVDARPPFDPLPAGALEEAKANLRDQFAVVGVTSRFDEALLLMKYKLGWTHGIHYARQNAAAKKTSSKSVDPALLEKIKQHTSLDAELVAYANELLDKALAAQGQAFAHELAALKRRNHQIYLLTQAWKGTWVAKLFSLPGFRLVRHVVGATVHRFF